MQKLSWNNVTPTDFGRWSEIQFSICFPYELRFPDYRSVNSNRWELTSAWFAYFDGSLLSITLQGRSALSRSNHWDCWLRYRYTAVMLIDHTWTATDYVRSTNGFSTPGSSFKVPTIVMAVLWSDSKFDLYWITLLYWLLFGLVVSLSIIQD